ncbi:MAG: glycosyltransferase, partial [Rhodospirillales bacterium]|nr:glycosyltransferase [Rhodospirillales bacterium]
SALMFDVIYCVFPLRGITGGTRWVFRHVEALRAMGVEAAVALSEPRVPSWFDSAAPVIAVAEIARFPKAWVVLPEDARDGLRALAGLPNPKAVFCQSVHFIAWGLSGASSYSAFGIHHAMASSQTIQDFCRWRLPDVETALVPCVIDSALFRSAAAKRPAIALMPRKRVVEANAIRDMMVHAHSDLAGVEWLPIENMSERETAETLGRAAAFLSLSRLEGFGLTPLEAMAAGCLVAGFTGGGGLEYATRDNGLWVAEDDCRRAAEALAQVMRWHLAGAPEAEAMRAAGCRTVERYGEERFKAALAGFWARRLGAR